MEYNILVLSDIHLGHNVTKTEYMVESLRKFFITYKTKITTTKLIVVPGDVFHKLLGSNSSDMLLATMWLTELIMYCKKYNIIIRFLEGTESHDWKQLRVIYNIIKNLNIDVNVKYIEELTIEYIEELDTNILYHPDNWKGTNDDIARRINAKLKEHGLTKVDIAVLHGAFKFQLPDFLDLLDAEYFLSIVKGPIFCGHIHTHSIYMRIIVPGSFEAMNFGDGEQPKGGIFVMYNTDGTFKIEFLKNRNQMRFKSYKVANKTIVAIKELLDKVVDNKLQHIRLLAEDDNYVKKIENEFKSMYPTIKLKIENVNNVKKDNKVIDVDIVNIKTIHLTESNITDYIKKNIKDMSLELQELVVRELKNNFT